MAIRIGLLLSDRLKGTSYNDNILDVLGGNDSLYGFAGNDVLESRDLLPRTNLLDGGEGNDTLLSYGGYRNTLIGGLGNDSLNSYDGNQNLLQGGANDDRISSYREKNTLLTGEDGNDVLSSSNGNSNELLGGEGNDQLSSIKGVNNILKGENGDDRIYTQEGNNIIYSGYGQDQIDSQGTDVLVGEYQNSQSPIVLNTIELNLGNGLIIGAQVNTSFSSIESFKFWGGQFNDTLVAGNGDNTLDGGAGDDILNGQAGKNTILGQAGNDTILVIESGLISGGTGNDFMLLREGNFEANGDEDNDTIFMLEATGKINGGNGFDLLGINYQTSTFGIVMEYNALSNSGFLKSGSRQISFADIEQLEIFGSLGDDQLLGTNSSDLFNGNEGIDTIAGGLGADEFRFFKPNSGVDIIPDFDVSEDRINIVTAGSPINPQFPQLGVGEFQGLTITATKILALEQFTIGTNATDSNHRIIYNSLTGDLLYDADGVGNIEAIRLAQLSPNLDLNPSNFIVR